MDTIMMRLKWLGTSMIAIMLILTGCQGEEGIDTQEPEDTQEEQIVSIAETFIDLLNEGNYEDATEHFDETMAKELSPSALEEIWVLIKNINQLKKLMVIRLF